jgi:ATP-dependent Clp protease adaptor protein ClpS
MNETSQKRFVMTQAPLQRPVQLEDIDTDVLVDQPAKVILFNDEVHSFDEVIGQIIKATGCDMPKAESLTWEVHTSGKAMVFEGEMDNCLKVSHILEEIALNTQIEI